MLAPTVTPWLVERFGKLPRDRRGHGARHARLRALPAARAGLDVPAMLPTILLVGVAFALAYGTLTIAATDGIAEAEQGLASGLQYVSLQFGAALGLAVVAAVNVAATNGSSEAALLDGFQAALFVPGRRRGARAGRDGHRASGVAAASGHRSMLKHLRTNPIALLALFIALGGPRTRPAPPSEPKEGQSQVQARIRVILDEAGASGWRARDDHCRPKLIAGRWRGRYERLVLARYGGTLPARSLSTSCPRRSSRSQTQSGSRPTIACGSGSSVLAVRRTFRPVRIGPRTSRKLDVLGDGRRCRAHQARGGRATARACRPSHS